MVCPHHHDYCLLHWFKYSWYDSSTTSTQNKTTTGHNIIMTFRRAQTLSSHLQSFFRGGSTATFSPSQKSRWRISCIYSMIIFTEYTWWPMYHLNFPKSFISPFIDPLKWEQYLLKSFLPTNPTKVNLSSTNSRWSDHSISFPKLSFYVSFSQLLSATWTLNLTFSCHQMPLTKKFPSLSIWRD